MKSLRHLIMPVGACVLGSFGCVSSDDQDLGGRDLEMSLEPQAGGTIYEPPRGRNGLKPSQFWSTTAQDAYRDIQHQPLKNGSFFNGADWIPVLNAPSGSPFHQLITTYPTAAKYLIECALSETQVVHFTHPDGTEEDIPGWFGLAPEWMDMPIDTRFDLQEWVTGCMGARLNYQGQSVDILLEGDTSAIQTNAAFESTFSENESTVFGNMFAPVGLAPSNKPAFNLYVCRDNALVTACSNFSGGQAYINRRICDDVPALCGLVDLGPCDPTALGFLGGCVQGSTSEHWKCRQGLTSTIYQFRTVGVQLEAPFEPSCY
ncbi:MAG TPA: hypothetical protein PKA58_33180 [Polyangium sp.]|nr:hypothetical protein [Polyangium sp.]